MYVFKARVSQCLHGLSRKIFIYVYMYIQDPTKGSREGHGENSSNKSRKRWFLCVTFAMGFENGFHFFACMLTCNIPGGPKFLSVTPAIFYFSLRRVTVLSSDGSRISQRGGTNSRGDAQIYYFAKLSTKTAWKWKNLDREGVSVPGAPPWILHC